MGKGLLRSLSFSRKLQKKREEKQIIIKNKKSQLGPGGVQPPTAAKGCSCWFGNGRAVGPAAAWRHHQSNKCALTLEGWRLLQWIGWGPKRGCTVEQAEAEAGLDPAVGSGGSAGLG